MFLIASPPTALSLRHPGQNFGVGLQDLTDMSHGQTDFYGYSYLDCYDDCYCCYIIMVTIVSSIILIIILHSCDLASTSKKQSFSYWSKVHEQRVCRAAVLGIITLVLGKYFLIGYLDP